MSFFSNADSYIYQPISSGTSIVFSKELAEGAGLGHVERARILQRLRMADRCPEKCPACGRPMGPDWRSYGHTCELGHRILQSDLDAGLPTSRKELVALVKANRIK